MMQAAIYGLEGLEMSAAERDFFSDAEPAAFSAEQAALVWSDEPEARSR